MQVEVNGQLFQTSGADSVRDLLREIGREGVPCAVEVNRVLVPHTLHATHTLREGDRIEIVTLVGGG